MVMADADTLNTLARRLGSVLEPVIGQLYFSPKCHANSVALGFDPSPGEAGGVALPGGPAYSRTRSWTDAQLDAAHQRLQSRG